MVRRIAQRGEWVTTQTACRELGLDRDQLSRLIDNGKIPTYRISGLTRLRREDVNRAKFLVGRPR